MKFVKFFYCMGSALDTRCHV